MAQVRAAKMGHGGREHSGLSSANVRQGRRPATMARSRKPYAPRAIVKCTKRTPPLDQRGSRGRGAVVSNFGAEGRISDARATRRLREAKADNGQLRWDRNASRLSRGFALPGVRGVRRPEFRRATYARPSCDRGRRSGRRRRSGRTPRRSSDGRLRPGAGTGKGCPGDPRGFASTTAESRL